MAPLPSGPASSSCSKSIWRVGLLALLPLSLIAGSQFGPFLDGEASLRRFLAYHVGFSALTLALALVHLYSVVMYR